MTDDVGQAASCVETVRRGDTWHPRMVPCGKPAKGEHNGKPLCGVHLRMPDHWAELAIEEGRPEVVKAIRELIGDD